MKIRQEFTTSSVQMWLCLYATPTKCTVSNYLDKLRYVLFFAYVEHNY